MGKIKYGVIHLPETLVEELKSWKQAYSNVAGHSVSYGEIIRECLDNIKGTNPVVYSEMRSYIKKHPEKNITL